MRLFCSAASAVAMLLAAPAFAQDRGNNAGDSDKRAPDPYHDEDSSAIVVTAPFQRNQDDILSGTTVLTGAELTRQMRPTVGETLARQPGVSATSFGPNASRPVLRGLQGERVRVLTDGIGSFDVSNTSVDHAVAINPLTADRIEVLRGPAALLFGSSAIGGVVNVVDSRIPRRVPDEPIHIEGLATYGSASNERTGSAAVDVPLGDKLVIHADGSYTKTGDLETGGFILSRQQRATALASGDPDIADLASLRGRLPNSAAESWEVAGGAALITDGGNLGFSVSHFDTFYGVPVRYSLDPSVEAERVRLDVKQTRADVRAEVETGDGFIERLRFRAGAADYEHHEVEESGEIATTFLNQSLEGRLELVQAERGGWKGASGVQYFTRDFNVIGEEKFVPRNNTSQIGLFTLQTFDLGPFRAEAGARFERTTAEAHADEDLGNPDLSRRFNAYSGSIGASYAIAGPFRIGLNLTHSERAPAAEELFANGPHAGTQAFEVGDPTFVKEKSNGVEATLKGSGDGYSLGLSAYYTRFSDFIYEQPTGEVEDDLPVFQFQQDNARFYGFEVDASLRLATLGSTAIVVDGVADYTNARIKGVGPVPRIPPLRVLGGIEAQGKVFQARAEVEHVSKQDRIAAFETPTDAYTMVNASLSFKPFGAENRTSIVLSANNIFDVTARRHASFLKDFAPLAGRDFRVSARFAF
jgi:iron complex outermembrane receptor protein